MPVNDASWSITTTLSSASTANVRCSACPDPRSTTGRRRCVNRRSGSWPGSTLCIWRIPAAAAAGWWIIWPGTGSQSAVTGCETSCDAWVYGRSTRNRAPLFQDLPLSGFPAWWTSNRSPGWIRSGRPTSPTSRYRKDSSTWWRSWPSQSPRNALRQRLSVRRQMPISALALTRPAPAVCASPMSSIALRR